MRAAPEQAMINDITELIATGEDLNATDEQGATLVRKIPMAFLQPTSLECNLTCKSARFSFPCGME